MDGQMILPNLNKNVSILAMRRKTRNTISTLLNPVKIIPNENGLPRDWQGLTELCGISGEKLPNLQRHSDPTSEVLNLWRANCEENSTISNLLKYLEELDRFDIIDDITDLLEEDISFFHEHPDDFKAQPLDLEADKYILTIDDVSRMHEGLELINYDAFVLFADDDIDFATELIEVMEKEYNLKFCVKDRDLVGGGFEHESIIKLISERCSRLVVIISTAFLNSPANKFFCTFAQAIGIEQRKRKIIPCVYKACEKLPPELSCYFMLDYRRSGKLCNFWDKLRDSITTPKYKEVKKVAVNRSISQYNNEPIKQYNSMHHSSLKPINQSVKFNSMVNLNNIDNNQILLNRNLSASTSANSLENVKKAQKPKRKWFPSLLHKSNEIKATNCSNTPKVEKEKKHFWNRYNKGKMAVAN